MDVAWSAPQGAHYNVDVIYLLYYFTVLQVMPTPTRFPTNSLYTPMDNTSLHSIPSVRHPWGWMLFRIRARSLVSRRVRLANFLKGSVYRTKKKLK